MQSLIIFALGLSVGSFLNVLIFRLPREENFVRGRSKCPSCGHVLGWQDLFPLASFLFLRGKCRFCAQKISWRYFFVELLTGTVFLLFWPFYIWLAIICLLIVLIFIDFEYFLIPDKILIVAGFLVLSLQLTNQSISPLLNSFLTAVFSGLIFFLIFAVTGKKKMGFGDVKLMVLLGFIFGFPVILPVFYLAVAGAVVWGIVLILFFGGKLQTKLPFGTLLAGSAVIFILFNKFLIPPLMPYIFRLYV